MNINRKIKPTPSGLLEIKLPEIETFTMQNGLEVFYVYKPDLPITQISLMVESGSKFDPQGKKGLSTLTSMLIDEGAGSYDALEFDEEIESIGTILNISGDHDYIYFSMLTLIENFNRSFELLSYILLDPAFTQNDFLKQKNKLITKLVQLKDDPSYIGRTVFEKMLFNNTSYEYPATGLEKNIETISVGDIKQFYKENFSPNKSKLIIVGDLKKEDLNQAISTYLKSWHLVESPQISHQKIVPPTTKYYYIHRDNAPQTEIIVGNIAGNRGEPDYFNKVILNSILGGQFTSRINLNLREDKGYTYGANSSFSYNKEFGTFLVSTSVQSKHTKDSVTEILNELENIHKGVTEKELEFSKSYLTKKYPSQFETYNQITLNLAILANHSLPKNYFNNYTEELNNVNFQGIVEASKKNILNKNFVIVLIGNRNVLTEQFNNELIELDYEGNPV